MDDRYRPPSDFLQDVIDDKVPLSDAEHGEANLHRLIEMMRDEHWANRDWATFLLAQQDINTPESRAALLAAADDENESVRSEAILGLAQRDKSVALPLLQRELAGEFVQMPIFEAAALVADASLVEDLRSFASPSGDDYLDELALDALKACETVKPTPT